MKKYLVSFFILVFLIICNTGFSAVVDGTNAGFVLASPSANPADSDVIIDTYAVGAKFTSPADAAKIVEMGWYCSNATEEANFEVGIYDNDGSPDVLLFSDITNAKGTDEGWKKVTGLDWAVSGNTIYWLAIQVDNTNTTTEMDYNSSGSSREFESTSALNNPWTGGNATERTLAIYAVYETAAGGRTRRFF